MGTVRQWDSLLRRISSVGWAGGLPRGQDPLIEKVLDEQQRRMSQLEEVLRFAVDHLRRGPVWSGEPTGEGRNFRIRAEDAFSNGRIEVLHEAGLVLDRFIVTAHKANVDITNVGPWGWFRMVSADEHTTTFQFDAEAMANNLVVHLVLYRSSFIPLDFTREEGTVLLARAPGDPGSDEPVFGEQVYIPIDTSPARSVAVQEFLKSTYRRVLMR